MELESGHQVLKRVIEMVTSLVVTQSTDTLRKVEQCIQNQSQSKNTLTYLNQTFSSLLEQRIISELPAISQDSRSVRVSYKTYDSNSYQVVSEQFWYFEIKATSHGLIKNKHQKGFKSYLVGLLRFIDSILKANSFKNKKGAFTNYQIVESIQNRMEKYSLQSRAELQFEQNSYLIRTTVLQPLELQEIPPTYQILDRKLSSETNCTLSKKQSLASKRKSVYSFYDEESQFTLLSGTRDHFECQLSEESIVITEDDKEAQDQEEPEWILTEEDSKLKEFMASLEKIGHMSEHFITNNPLV